MIIAGTGHRPNKLGGYGADVHDRLVRLAVKALQHYGATRVISGMALGWDMALAEAALQLGLPFDAYIPFTGQESKWPASSQQQYRTLLAQASHVEVCSPGAYSVDKMQIRNERMVDDCEFLLALWDGTAGGTGNCMNYARRTNRTGANCWKAWSKQ